MNIHPRMPYWLKGCTIGIMLSLASGLLVYVLLLNAKPFPFLGGGKPIPTPSNFLIMFFLSPMFLFVFLFPLSILGTFFGVMIGLSKKEQKLPSIWIMLAIAVAIVLLSCSYFGLL